MPAYFGSGGQLFEVKCPASADRVSDRPGAPTRTLGGKVKWFSGPAARRSWSLNVGAGTPKDVSTIEALAGFNGSLVWIPPEAAVGNLLSPQASGFQSTPNNGSLGGLVSLPDGTAANSVVHTGGSVIYVGNTGATFSWEMVPVTPGVPISVGVWARGGSRITGSFRDVNGTHLSTPDSGTQTNAGWTWQTATFTPPASATHYIMAVSAGTQYARPSVSWGSVPADEIGTGCPKAVVHSAEYSPIAAHRRLNRSRITYSVTEVG